MPTLQDVQTWRGQTLFDTDHDKIGEIADVYLDRRSGEPEWLAVKTGMFGSTVTFVPIQQAGSHEGHVMVPYEKSLVKDAPNVSADGELSPEEERRLYEHYHLEFGDFDHAQDHGTRGEERFAGDTPGTVGHDTSGPTTDDAMTRSEEELAVGRTERETGRALVDKRVVPERVRLDTETVTEERHVSEEVRKEQIEADGDGGRI